MAKILIVDDAAFMRKVIRDMLAKNGYDRCDRSGGRQGCRGEVF